MLTSFTEEVSLESVAQLCSQQAVRDMHTMRLHEVSNYQRYQPGPQRTLPGHSITRRVSHVVFLFFTRGFLFCSSRQLCQSHGHLPSLNNLYPLYSTPKPLAKSTPSSNFIPLRFGTNNYNLQNFEHVYRHGFGLIRRVLQGGGSQWSRHGQ